MLLPRTLVSHVRMDPLLSEMIVRDVTKHLMPIASFALPTNALPDVMTASILLTEDVYPARRSPAIVLLAQLTTHAKILVMLAPTPNKANAHFVLISDLAAPLVPHLVAPCNALRDNSLIVVHVLLVPRLSETNAPFALARDAQQSA